MRLSRVSCKYFILFFFFSISIILSTCLVCVREAGGLKERRCAMSLDIFVSSVKCATYLPYPIESRFRASVIADSADACPNLCGIVTECHKESHRVTSFFSKGTRRIYCNE